MLGNFSFGDYFRKEAIPFAWELLTDVWKMPKDKFVVSIFKGENGIPRDDEAYEIWRKLGIPADRILELGQRRQLLVDGRHGAVRPVLGDLLRPRRHRHRSRNRNLEQRVHGVRAQRGRHADALPAPSIDTGMGLERMTAVMQNVHSDYDTDCFQPLLRRIGELAGIEYGARRTSATSRCASSPTTSDRRRSSSATA